uniref:CST complex subunit CTC1 n=1 Tax=Spongospora subterranea TaxID=70186 RepID=A0A0H5RAU8_9EUKA|eukprot:CRZ11183.1 hypothetical protein [Spongospora subterranea]
MTLEQCSRPLPSHGTVSVSFVVAALSRMFKSEAMFLIEAICSVNNHSSAFIVFSEDSLNYRPFIKVGSRYKLLNARVKIVRYSHGNEMSVLLANSKSQLIASQEQTDAKVKFQIYSDNVFPEMVHCTLTYQGKVTAQLLDGVFELDHSVNVHFTHSLPSCLHFGIGVRVGAIVLLHNVHRIYDGDSTMILGLCTYSTLEIVAVAPSLTPSIPWRRTAIAKFCERLNLSWSVRLSRTLLILKAQFRSHCSSAALFLDNGRGGCICLDIICGPQPYPVTEYQRSHFIEFVNHGNCKLVPHPSLLLSHPIRAVSFIADLVNILEPDMSEMGCDRVMWSKNRQLLSGIISTDRNTGALILTDSKKGRIRCHVSDISINAIGVPIVTDNFGLVDDGAIYAIFSLSSCTFVSSPAKSRPMAPDRCTLAGCIRQIFPSSITSTTRFSALIDMDHDSSSRVIVVFRGMACAIEPYLFVDGLYRFVGIIPLDAVDCSTKDLKIGPFPTFMADNDSEISLLKHPDPDLLDSVDKLLDVSVSDKALNAIVSLKAAVVEKVIRPDCSMQNSATLVLTLQSLDSIQTLHAYIPVDLRRLPLNVLIGRTVNVYRIFRHITKIGKVCLSGSSETVLFVPDQCSSLPQPTSSRDYYSDITTTSLQSIRSYCYATVTSRIFRIVARIAFITSLTLQWAPSNDHEISSFKLSTVIDDGSGQATLMLEGESAWAVVPHIDENLMKKLRGSSDANRNFHYTINRPVDSSSKSRDDPNGNGFIQELSELFINKAHRDLIVYARALFPENTSARADIGTQPPWKNLEVMIGKSHFSTVALPRLQLSCISVKKASVQCEAFRLLMKQSRF